MVNWILVVMVLASMGCAMDAPFLEIAVGDAHVQKMCIQSSEPEIDEVCGYDVRGGTISSIFGDVLDGLWKSATRIVAMFYGGSPERALDDGDEGSDASSATLEIRLREVRESGLSTMEETP